MRLKSINQILTQPTTINKPKVKNMNQVQQPINMNQLMDDLMIHCTHTEQICVLIRLAAATSGVRYGMNLHDVVPGDDVEIEETYDYWSFLFPDSMGEMLKGV